MSEQGNRNYLTCEERVNKICSIINNKNPNWDKVAEHLNEAVILWGIETSKSATKIIEFLLKYPLKSYSHYEINDALFKNCHAKYAYPLLRELCNLKLLKTEECSNVKGVKYKYKLDFKTINKQKVKELINLINENHAEEDDYIDSSYSYEAREIMVDIGFHHVDDDLTCAVGWITQMLDDTSMRLAPNKSKRWAVRLVESMEDYGLIEKDMNDPDKWCKLTYYPEDLSVNKIKILFKKHKYDIEDLYSGTALKIVNTFNEDLNKPQTASNLEEILKIKIDVARNILRILKLENYLKVVGVTERGAFEYQLLKSPLNTYYFIKSNDSSYVKTSIYADDNNIDNQKLTDAIKVIRDRWKKNLEKHKYKLQDTYNMGHSLNEYGQPYKVYRYSFLNEVCRKNKLLPKKEEQNFNEIQNYIIKELARNKFNYYSSSEIIKLIHGKPKCKGIKKEVIYDNLRNLYNDGIIKYKHSEYYYTSDKSDDLFQLKESPLAGITYSAIDSEEYINIKSFLEKKEKNDPFFKYLYKSSNQNDNPFKKDFNIYCKSKLQGYCTAPWLSNYFYYQNPCLHVPTEISKNSIVFYKLSDLEEAYKKLTGKFEDSKNSPNNQEPSTNYESLVTQTEEHYTKQINELKEQLKESQEQQQKQFDEIKELVEKNSGYIIPIQSPIYKKPTLKEKIKKFFNKFKPKTTMHTIPDELEF